MPRAPRITGDGHEVVVHTLRRWSGQPRLGEFLARCTCGWLSQNVNRDLITRDSIIHVGGREAA